MKFLIDAQLPPSLKQLFIDKGYDCIHTLDLETGNETPDHIINKISVEQQRILITKDSDFVDSFIINSEPYKLIMVKLGNTSKNELIQFFTDRFVNIIEMIKGKDMILINRENYT
jgi:predicted nuclease of predicted toxin-antitoxin system